jgi:hypothetical protein
MPYYKPTKYGIECWQYPTSFDSDFIDGAHLNYKELKI